MKKENLQKNKIVNEVKCQGSHMQNKSRKMFTAIQTGGMIKNKDIGKILRQKEGMPEQNNKQEV